MRGLVTLAAALCLFVLVSPAWSGAASGNSPSTLRRTRDLLLPRLISGEVDVSALDIDVGTATLV